MEIDSSVMNEFDAFLQGKHIPEGFRLKDLPNLQPEQAWTVIYVIQEWLGLISERFEKCSVCGKIYDTNCEGIYSGDNLEEMEDWNEAGYNFSKDNLQKHFCGGCAP